jgi:hypothetical protein
MDVHVDEARCQDSSRPVGDGEIRMAGRDGGEIAGVQDALAPVSVGADDKQAVLVEDGLAGDVKSQKRGAVRLHGLGE